MSFLALASQIINILFHIFPESRIPIRNPNAHALPATQLPTHDTTSELCIILTKFHLIEQKLNYFIVSICRLCIQVLQSVVQCKCTVYGLADMISPAYIQHESMYVLYGAIDLSQNTCTKLSTLALDALPLRCTSTQIQDPQKQKIALIGFGLGLRPSF